MRDIMILNRFSRAFHLWHQNVALQRLEKTKEQLSLQHYHGRLIHAAFHRWHHCTIKRAHKHHSDKRLLEEARIVLDQGRHFVCLLWLENVKMWFVKVDNNFDTMEPSPYDYHVQKWVGPSTCTTLELRSYVGCPMGGSHSHLAS